uniref:MyD88 n=1 Tax=Ditylenchus dipsaci TaxID=166011 RepID=A0A915EU92_9BILA
MLDQDDEDEDSLTVTIALESAVHDFQPYSANLPEKLPCSPTPFDNDHENESPLLTTSSGKVLRKDFRLLRPPTKPTQVCPVVAPNILIKHLSAETRKILESMLNPCVEGRLKNWEYVCASLGVSIDEISDMRRKNNPTAQVLKDFKDVSVNRFLEIFCDMRRVDLLYMIRSSVLNLQKHDILPDKSYLNDSGLLFDSTYSMDSTKSTVPAEQCQPSTSTSSSAKTKELRAYYRMLLKNLNNSCLSGFSLLDIEKCVDEQNLNNAIHEIYDKANQILLVFSADYSRTIDHGLTSSDSSQIVPTIVKIKQMVHSYTNSEYIKNGMKNKRFRIVLFEGTDSRLIPNGWPSNTIVYDFPSNFSDLCDRLFAE